jgi:uncharacterized protein (TIGR03437 family)
LVGLAFTALFSVAQAQSVITTVAGTDFTFPNTPIPGTNAPTGNIFGVVADPNGNVFISDYQNFKVFKLDPRGVLTVVAGNSAFVPYGGAYSAASGDGGPAIDASLCFPSGLALDKAGNLYIADECSFRIRKATPAGIITTVAGSGAFGYSGDGGPAVNASLSVPTGVAVDSTGALFIADYFNNVIRKVTPDGIITTFAGTGTAGYSGDGGPAATATLNGPISVTVDARGDLFIADNSNSVIRQVTPAGIISTFAGNGTFLYSGDGGPALNASLCSPYGMTVDTTGDLFISDQCNQVIRKVSPAGIISTVAGVSLGSGYAGGFSGDGGPATNAELNFPGAVAVDSSGDLFIADSHNHRLREVNTAGIIQTIVGNGNFQFSGDGGPAITATLDTPSGVIKDASGDLFVADTKNNRIRKITPDGIISTVAGNGQPNSSQAAYPGENGPAVNAPLTYPISVALDGAGNLFIADTFANAIRKVTPDGNIHTVVRLDTSSGGGVPFRVVVDAGGNLFIADTYGNAIRKFTPAGDLFTVAGNGTAGYTGDSGPATSAALNYPTGLALDAAGDLFISDSANNVIRKVTPAGIISTYAGNGKSGYSGDGGPATQASFFSPQGLTVDAAGNLYIADDNSVIRMVNPAGIISTIAGNGNIGYSGDGGVATQAELGVYPDPTGEPDNSGDVAVDSSGDLFIADPNNNRIREVLANRPLVTVSPKQVEFSAASNGAPATPQFLGLISPVEGVAFSLTTDANWLQITPSSGASPRLIQVVADPKGLAPNTYQATINISTPTGNPAYTLVPVTFQVGAALPPTLSIDKMSLSFPFPQQGIARSQTITVSNTGSGALQFSATTTTTSGGNWLSESPGKAQAVPGSPVPLTVTANPAGLSPGAYSGQMTIASGAQSQTVAVTMTISTLNQAILLSQSGLSFLAVQAGGVIPSQSFGVTNIGTGVVTWTASTSTLAGGPDWLQVTPSAGSSDASASTGPRVTVSVNGSVLPAGTYYGLVRVDAPGAANSPQVLTVFLQVLPANTTVPGVVQPAQLVFTTATGAGSPPSQTIQVFNIAAGTRSFQSHLSLDSDVMLATTPQNVTLDPQQPTSIVVQPVIAGHYRVLITTDLHPGVYNAVLTLQFSDGTVSAVQVKVVVANSAAPAPSLRNSAPKPADVGAGCAPSMLLPTLTTLGQGFAVSAGWPAALIVNVTDDCGMPMPNTGSVTVNFSNGDQPLSLLAQGAGNWESTWQTGNAGSAGVTIKIHAENSQGLTGDAVLNGNLQSQQQPPVFGKSGIVSPATAASFTALAPGAAITIYGSSLAENTAQAQGLPLPQQLADTQVFVSGTTTGGASTGLLPLPLYYVSQNQLNALIPYEVSVDTSLQLLVRRGNTYSVPVQIDMASTQPAVFSLSGAPGSPGVISVYPSNGKPYLAGPNTPAHVGDTIVVYCSGLGAVNPGVTDGAAAPGQPLSSTLTSPQLTIGGQSAPVSFAGLTPGFAGLYQVNAVVPSGVPSGAAVPVTLNIEGQTSPLTTIAIQ